MTRIRVGVVLVALLIAIALAGTLLGRGGTTSTPTPNVIPSASTTAGPATQAVAPTPTRTPIIQPTPAIPLPQCPSEVVPEVDNPARYGFCVPPGWGAYNENNTLTVTQILKPHPGDTNPALLPTDFARIAIVIALDTPAPTNPPADCTGSPNATVAGYPARHCSVPLDPASNPYHADLAQFWRLDLPQGGAFYMTAQSAQATQTDLEIIAGIVDLVKPLGSP